MAWGKGKLRRGKREYKGVQKTNSGNYASMIWDPFKRRRVWLGTYGSLEKASEMYLSKKNEFDEKLRADQGTEFLDHEKSTAQVNDQDDSDKDRSQMDIMEEGAVGDDDNDSGDFVKEKGLSGSGNSGNEESEFGVLFGVRVVDRYGFLLGEFSKLDDLSFCSFEEDHQMVSDYV